MVCDFKSESLLIQAVFEGDLEQVISLINNRVDVNYQSSNGRLTALHAAAHCCESSSKPIDPDSEPSNDAANEANSQQTSDEIKEKIDSPNRDTFIHILNSLLRAGAKVNSKDSKNLTPLHYACRSNSEEAVCILIENQADVNSRDRNWQSPLHVCAMYNSIESARLLLPLITNIDASDKQSRSALAHAAFNGNLEMVELLLENGANCNIQDKQERRPLHWASYVGYTDIIRVLIKHGADINCLDKELFTPILVACASGKSEETINLLIELGADCEATTVHDSSIFHLACLNGHDMIVKELLYKHNLPMKVNNKGFHPLHYAAACKQGGFCLELLVSLNVDVNLASHVDGTTPMHVAALHGRTSCAQILYSNGSQINVKNSNDNTPLHLAAFNGHTSMMSFLIECGANIYIRGNNGMLAWAIATLNGHFECFKILDQIVPTISARKQFFETKDDYGRTFMHLAAISGNYECLSLFLRSDCNLNETDDSGNTPLHYACVGAYLKCVELLVRSGAEVNEVNKSLKNFNRMDLANKNEAILNIISNNLNPCGCTPLMLACAFDSEGLVVRDLILNAHARADITDKYGYNSLHYAAFQGNSKVFEILLDQCKDLDHQYNERSISPLHILAYYGHREALDFLLRYLPDPDVKDRDGRTPLDLACYRGESSCVECLMLHNASYETKDNINGRTPLHAAAFNNNDECLKIISLIVNSKLSSSARLNETYDYYSNANEETNQTNGIYNSKLANLRDSLERTPLMIAVEQGHLSTINFLITQMGADVFANDSKNRTALHRAAALGYEECCVEILKADCSSLMQRDLSGLLPIHYAILAGHASLLFVFFEYYENYLDSENSESDINQSFDSSKPIDRLVDLKGFSLLHFACFNGHSTCTETICDLGENYPFLIEMFDGSDESNIYNRFTPLHCASFNSHEACVAILLEKFPDRVSKIIELEDKNGNRPLHICAMNNEYDCALLLIEASCTLNERNIRGHTPFMLAAAFSSFNIMEILLSDERESKVDLSSVDYKGNNALHLALLNNHENCALFLLDKIEPMSPMINSQNFQGQTPLHLAASKGFITVVEILLSKGADIWIKNKRQQTALVSCAKNDQVAECLNLMISLLVSTLSQQSNKANTMNKTNLMMMMMMMTPTSKTPAAKVSNHLHHNRFLNEQNNSSIIENKNDINPLNDSTYTLTTSDVVLNDVNMNSTNNNTRSSIETNQIKNPHNKLLNSIQKSATKSQFNKREDTNLNSTLIINDNEINVENSSSGTSSRTSSRTNSAASSNEQINHEMEEQEEGELIEDDDEEEDDEEEIQLGEILRAKSLVALSEDEKLIELVQTKTSPLKTIKTNTLFDADFF